METSKKRSRSGNGTRAREARSRAHTLPTAGERMIGAYKACGRGNEQEKKTFREAPAVFPTTPPTTDGYTHIDEKGQEKQKTKKHTHKKNGAR